MNENPPDTTRSGIPKSMGILLIVFASIYLLSSLVSAATAFLGGSFMDILPVFKSAMPKLEKSGISLDKLLGQLRPVYVLQGCEKLATAAISGFGLLAGVRLVQYSASGLKLSVWWGISALSYLVLEVMIFFMFLQPILNKFFKTISEQIAPLLGADKAGFDVLMAFAGNAGAGSIITGAIFMAVFPVLMIVLMNTSAAKRACGVDKVFG